MEVTRKNFTETLPLVAQSIEKADFIAIDAEFTGLINGKDVSIFDSPEEYYTCLLNGCTEFLLIQFGVCAFYWDEDEKRYVNDAYNFYLFPRGKPGPEKMFLCQSSSLDFLAAQGFDFNKLIKEGISYMTEPTETRLRDNLSERQKIYSNVVETISIPDENKQQIEEICNKVQQFLKENKSEEMEIDRCNAWIRRLLFQELGARFKNEVFVETKILENKNRVLKVTRIKSANDGNDRDTLKKDKEWEEFEEAVGFSKVARMISQSGKLVIGHNMLLDVIHTLNHFFQPVPTDYLSFKEFAHCMFPKLLDTKYMSSLPPFKDKVTSSVLQHLFATLSEPPFSLPNAESKEGRGYSKTEKNHEAGYDAYVTGLCFLAMHAHLTRVRGDPFGRVTPAHFAALKPFINKLFLAKTAYQDSPYMNLAGHDPTPSRDHVFHLTFPQEWQRNDLNQLFSPFGPITLQFLEDTSALVALLRREQARDVMRALSTNPRVTVLPYARYKMQTQAPPKDPDERRRDVVCAVASDTAAGHKRVNSSSSMASPPIMSPQRMERVRTNSLSLSPPPLLLTVRKRTSSGVFQVDDAGPPAKKAELVRSNSDNSRKKCEAVSNGRRKVSSTDSEKDKSKAKEVKGKSKDIKEKSKEKDISVITKFDIGTESKCVSAFKESDTWD